MRGCSQPHPGSLLKRAWACTIFPNVWTGNPGVQAARSCSTLQPNQDIDEGLQQTHSLDIVTDKFMHISISAALKKRTMGPHYQPAGENFPHLVPGAMLMWDKMLDSLRKRIIEEITSSAQIVDKHRHVYIQVCGEMFPVQPAAA